MSDTIDNIDQAVRVQKCTGCGGVHVSQPVRLSSAAMTWHTAMCANRECLSFGREMALMEIREHGGAYA